MRLIDADAIKLYYGGLVHIPYNDFIGIANYFMNQIKEMPTVTPEPHWIPVTERLPEEDGGLYLVTDYAKSINRRRMHLSRCYMNKEGFWSDVPIGYKVVAWTRLPEPYEGGNDV